MDSLLILEAIGELERPLVQKALAYSADHATPELPTGESKSRTKQKSVLLKNKQLWKWGALAASIFICILAGILSFSGIIGNKNHDFLIEGGVLLSYRGQDSNIIIPDRVTAIAERAFLKGGNADKIESITLGRKVAYVDAMAFEGCTNLKSVTLSPQNQSLQTNDRAVLSADGLQLIYYNASDATQYAVPIGVEKICSYAFVNSGLTELIFPETVTQLDQQAVIFNDQLQKVTLCGVVSLSDKAFYNNISLKEIDLPAAETIGEAAFSGCTALEKVILPKAVSLQSSAFANCTSLQSVTAPLLEEIGDNAFYQCTALQKLSFPRVKYIGNEAFRRCTALSGLDISSAERLGDWVIAESNLSILILPNIKGSLNEFTFAGNGNIQLWGIPDSYLEHFAREHGYTFKEIQNMDLPAGFSPVDDFMYISVGAVNVRSAPILGDNIVGGLYLDDEIHRVATDGTWSMFLYSNGAYCFVSNSCLSKTVSTFKPVTPTDKTYGDFAYTEQENCIRITKYNGSATAVVLPASIDGKPVEELSANAFYAIRKKIESLHADTVKRIIGSDAFLSNCYRLTSLQMPLLENLPSGSLFECVSLTDVNVKGLKTIGSDVFVCGNFTELYLNDATQIAENAFTRSGIKTLHGHTGSYTEVFANAHGYGFIDISNDYLPAYPPDILDPSTLHYTQIYHGTPVGEQKFSDQGVAIGHDTKGKLYLYIKAWGQYIPTAFAQFEGYALENTNTTYQTATVFENYAWLVASGTSGAMTDQLSVLKITSEGATTYGSIDLGQTRNIQGLYLSFHNASCGKLIISYSEQYQKCTVYETDDGGITWKVVSTGEIFCNNGHERVIAAGFADQNIGLISYSYSAEEQPYTRTYLTFDGGKTWSKWNTVLPADLIGNGYGEVADLQYQNGILTLTVAVAGGDLQNPVYYHYQSTDQGNVWILMP